MKSVSVMLATVLMMPLASMASGKAYDRLMADCLQRGINGVTQEQLMQCHQATKNYMLSNFDRSMAYLECVDYEHSPVSLEKEVQCLREQE